MFLPLTWVKSTYTECISFNFTAVFLLLWKKSEIDVKKSEIDVEKNEVMNHINIDFALRWIGEAQKHDRKHIICKHLLTFNSKMWTIVKCVPFGWTWAQSNGVNKSNLLQTIPVAGSHLNMASKIIPVVMKSLFSFFYSIFFTSFFHVDSTKRWIFKLHAITCWSTTISSGMDQVHPLTFGSFIEQDWNDG